MHARCSIKEMPGQRLGRLYDPEWLCFQALALAPTVFFLVKGDWARAHFFAGLALHLGTLKWLGWNVLTRNGSHELGWLLFPAEIFTGLALACFWFYIRNLLAYWLHVPYSLMELACLPYLILAIHVLIWCANRRKGAATGLAHGGTGMRPLIQHAGCYFFFILLTTIALYSVADKLFPPCGDGFGHSFYVRVYLHDGLFFPHFNGGKPIIYASGWGAINTTTAAISSLSAVEVVNLQHVLLTILGVYLIFNGLAMAIGQCPGLLHFFLFFVITLFPLHHLPPDQAWTHSGQMAAQALCFAIMAIPLLFSPRTRWHFCRIAFSNAILTVLTTAINPACVPFVLVSAGVAFVALCWRGRSLTGLGFLKAALVNAGLVALVAWAILGADRYYSRFVFQPDNTRYFGGENFGGQGGDKRGLLSFSVADGWKNALQLSPMEFTNELLNEGPGKLPRLGLLWFTLVLIVGESAVALAWRKLRLGFPGPYHALLGVCWGCLFLWLLTKYGITFFNGSIVCHSDDAGTLKAYLAINIRRFEVMVLIGAFLAATAFLLASLRHLGKTSYFLGTLAVAAILLSLLIPYGRTFFSIGKNGLTANLYPYNGSITPDDIQLVSWMDDNIPPEKGLVGIINNTWKAGETKIMLSFGNGMALPLYGKNYNFCFNFFDPSRPFSFDDYNHHVKTFLDVDWCLENNIRYFFLPTRGFNQNSAFPRAIALGLLSAVTSAPTSGLYAVEPLPWRPEAKNLRIRPSDLRQADWKDGVMISLGMEPQLEFALPQSFFVHAIRLRFKFQSKMNEGIPTVEGFPAKVLWRTEGISEYDTKERMMLFPLQPAEDEQTQAVLIHDYLDRFRFDLHCHPATLQIVEIILLVKPDDRPSFSCLP